MVHNGLYQTWYIVMRHKIIWYTWYNILISPYKHQIMSDNVYYVNKNVIVYEYTKFDGDPSDMDLGPIGCIWVYQGKEESWKNVLYVIESIYFSGISIMVG